MMVCIKSRKESDARMMEDIKQELTDALSGAEKVLIGIGGGGEMGGEGRGLKGVSYKHLRAPGSKGDLRYPLLLAKKKILDRG